MDFNPEILLLKRHLHENLLLCEEPSRRRDNPLVLNIIQSVDDGDQHPRVFFDRPLHAKQIGILLFTVASTSSALSVISLIAAR